jgi:hypothetical protein
MIWLPFINAAFIYGLYWAVYRGQEYYDEEDGPLSFVRAFTDRFGMGHYNGNPERDKCAKRWYYPIFYCVYCMSSVWGVLFFVAAMLVEGWPLASLAWLPVHLIATYGIVRWAKDVGNA